MAAPLPAAVLFGRLLIAGTLAVPGTPTREEHVDRDVHDGAAEEAAAVGPSPPDRCASSTRSKASAEISTPAPNAMIPATTRRDTRTHHATAAPSTSATPPTRPHSPASTHCGTRATFRRDRDRRSEDYPQPPVRTQCLLVPPSAGSARTAVWRASRNAR